MRKNVGVEYHLDPIYVEEIGAWHRGREPRLPAENGDSDGLEKAHIDYPREQKESLLTKLLVRLGRAYPEGPIDWPAERLLDHRGKPWLIEVSIHIFDGPEEFQAYWERTLFKLDPDLDRLADELEGHIQSKGLSDRDLVVKVREADGRSWICRRKLSSIEDRRQAVKEMFEIALSDEAVLTGPFSEVWEMRRRAISRVQST